MTGQQQRIEPTDDWQQLDLLVRFPEQHTYELIRPVVLFGHSPAERARQTGMPQRTLYRQAARFEREGMTSLFGPAKVERHRTLPDDWSYPGLVDSERLRDTLFDCPSPLIGCG